MTATITPINNDGPRRSIDPELQPYLARDGRRCLITLLNGQGPGEQVPAHEIAAVLMLIDQADTV